MADRTDRREGGTVLTGPDGHLYFIRDEVLPAFKVEGEGLARLQKEVGSKAPAKPAQGLVSGTYIKGDLLDKDPPAWTVHMPNITRVDIQKVRASTVMCPWFC